MGRRQLITVSFVLLTVLAATTWAQSGATTAPANSQSETAARMQAARRAGSGTVGQAPSTEGGSSKLDKILEKLRGTQMPNSSKDKAKAATSQPSGLAPAGAQGTQSPTPTTRPAGEPATQPSRATDDLSAKEKAEQEGLARLKGIAAGAIANPRALADDQYLKGRFKGAIVLYELAEKSVGKDDAVDMAWILYQLGNLHRVSDPDRAAGYYNRVQAEHGDSDWYAPAKTQADLIRWKQDNKPVELIKGITAETDAS